MSIIKLNYGKEALVDEVDLDRVLQRGPWLFVEGYAKTMDSQGCLIMLHRFIMSSVIDLEQNKSLVVDHINRDGLCNYRSNLRLVTKSENCRNRGAAKNNQTGFKGVYYNSSSAGKPWCAQIRHNEKSVTIGRYVTIQEAALAYNAAASILRGSSAVLNDVSGVIPFEEVGKRLQGL